MEPLSMMTGESKTSALPLMPDFEHGFYGFRHTLDSALRILESLGVPGQRISIRMAGLGIGDRCIARQQPPAGTPLCEDTQVVLHVSGLGFSHSLPVAMWHRGGEQGLGTTEILELLDDPLQKSLYWIREGSCLFDISPENPEACRKWISVFGIDPAHWSPELLYPNALLLASLPRLAGTEHGIRLALDLVLRLPLCEMQPVRSYQYLRERDLSLLGSRASRLSTDYVLGDRIEDAGTFKLVIGPVDLEAYYRFTGAEGSALLHQVLRLVMPCHGRWLVSWVVADPMKYPRLGVEKENSVLGVNSYLGPRQEVFAHV